MGNEPSTISMEYADNSPKSPVSPLKLKSQRFETYQIVLADPSVLKKSKNQSICNYLRSISMNLKIFNDYKSCEKWIEQHAIGLNIILIISGSVASEAVPKIHNLPSVVSICVIRSDSSHRDILSRSYTKVLYIDGASDEDFLRNIEKHHKNLENLEDSKMIMTFLSDENPDSDEWESKRAAFLWFPLFLEILKTTHYFPFQSTPAELLQVLRQWSFDNDFGLDMIDEFQESYQCRPICWWLLNNLPLSRLTNKALREQDISMLILLRFFLIDMYALMCIKQSVSLKCYKVQLMFRSQLEQIKANQSLYLSWNGFLFASSKEPILDSNNREHNTLETVILTINANSERNPSSFAFVRDLDPFANQSNEQEILFMCGSIFRIESLIKTGDSCWTLQLTLDNDGKEHWISNMKKKLEQRKNLCVIGSLLEQCGKNEQALAFYETIRKLFIYDDQHPVLVQLNERLRANATGSVGKCLKFSRKR